MSEGTKIRGEKVGGQTAGEKCPPTNFHCLLHIVEDVRNLVSLDEYSAFTYENNMSFFVKFMRKPDEQLQQIYRRMYENNKAAEKKRQQINTIVNEFRPFNKHNLGPIVQGFQNNNCSQYKSIQTKKLHFSVKQGNNCWIMNNEAIYLIENIIKKNEEIYFIVRLFHNIESFYDIGMLSASLGIFKCYNISTHHTVIKLEDIRNKCFQMPYWDAFYQDHTEILNLDSRFKSVNVHDCINYYKDPVPGTFIVVEMI